MGNNWYDLANEVLKKQTYQRYLEKTVDSISRRTSPWTFERRRLDKILGWKKVRRTKESTYYKTGETEVTRTSNNTFEVSEKTRSYSYKVDVMRLDKEWIIDRERYEELEKEISAFLYQAEKVIGPKVVPMMFLNKECLFYVLRGIRDIGKGDLFLGILLLAGLGLLTGMNWILPAIALVLVGGSALRVFWHRIWHASSRPLIEAYFAKVREFQDEIDRITK